MEATLLYSVFGRGEKKTPLHLMYPSEQYLFEAPENQLLMLYNSFLVYVHTYRCRWLYDAKEVGN